MSATVAGVTFNTGLYINGIWKNGRGQPLQSVNPATEEVIAEVSLLDCEVQP